MKTTRLTHLNTADRAAKLRAPLPARLLAFWVLALLGWALGAAISAPISAKADTSSGQIPAQPQCDPDWQVVSSPNVGSGSNHLNAIDAAITGSDVWAVGYYFNGSVDQTLIERRGASQWVVVPSGNAGTNTTNQLYGVAAVSSTSAWAVGYYQSGTADRTLIERWSGSFWGGVLSPNVGTFDNQLLAVAAVSDNDVWAVGEYINGTTARTLIEHWNGSAWSIVPSPNVGTHHNYLTAVAVGSAHDVWAVGTYLNVRTSRYQTLVLHWNGSTWSTVTTPNANGSVDNTLGGVTVISAVDVWAVGGYNTLLRTLILHWNGTAWSIVTSLNQGSSDNYLTGVAEIAASDVWAVGYYYDSSVHAYRTLIEHWNGSAWSIVTSPNFGISGSILYGVAVASASDVWAAGSAYGGAGIYNTLTERYNPCPGAPTSTPTNTPTRTPTRTNTPLPPPPTNTPTRTATPTNTPTPGLNNPKSQPPTLLWAYRHDR